MQAPSLSNDTALLPALLNGNGRSPGPALSPEGVIDALLSAFERRAASGKRPEP